MTDRKTWKQRIEPAKKGKAEETTKPKMRQVEGWHWHFNSDYVSWRPCKKQKCLDETVERIRMMFY